MTKNQRTQIVVLGTVMLGLLALKAGAAEAAATASNLATKSQVTSDLPSKKASLDLVAGLLSRSLEDEYASSKYAGGSIGIKGRHSFSSSISARLDISALLTSGAATNQYSSTGKAPNGLFVNEASATLKPVSFFTFDLGVMPARFATMPAILDANGFPTARETFETGGNYFSAKAFASQSIPTSDTVATQSTDEGKTAQLFIYGAGFTTNVKDLAPFTWSASVVAFDFRNLNAAAATDSRLLGNTVTTVGTQARFVYEFAGNEASSEISYRFSKDWKVSANGSYLVNNEGPEGGNKGYLYSGTLVAPIWGQSVSMTGGYFYNEPDTLPASYTSSSKGSNNRFGQLARLSVKNEKEKVSGYLQYVRANTIESRPYMADREIISAGLEIAYEIL